MKKIFGFFLIFLLFGCSAKEFKSEGLYQKIDKTDTLETVLNVLNKEKNFDAIIRLYEEREKNFNAPEQLYYVIQAYFKKKQYASIIKVMADRQDILKKVLGKDLYWAKVLGISYYQTGNLTQAQRFLEIAESDLNSEEVSLYLSLVYLKKGQYTMSLMAASKLSEDKKNFVQGLIYAKMKNWQKALQLFESVRDKNVKAYALSAYCYYMLGNVNQAEKIVTDERLKDDFLSNIIMAIILIEKGYVKKGLIMLEELLKKIDERSPYIEAIKYDLDIIYEFYLNNQKIEGNQNLK